MARIAARLEGYKVNRPYDIEVKRFRIQCKCQFTNLTVPFKIVIKLKFLEYNYCYGNQLGVAIRNEEKGSTGGNSCMQFSSPSVTIEAGSDERGRIIIIILTFLNLFRVMKAPSWAANWRNFDGARQVILHKCSSWQDGEHFRNMEEKRRK